MILRVNIVKAGYGKIDILKNISIDVKQGEMIVVIGPNGAGKSTLLKAIMGIIKIREGSIRYFEKEINNKSPANIIREGLSFIPQGNRVFSELSVLENIEIGGFLLKGRREISSQIKSILYQFPDLEKRINITAGKLSSGERQQLSIARAIMQNPKLILMDEPSSGLSPQLFDKIINIIVKINKELKTTLIIVEQRIKEIAEIADKIIIMNMGEILASGSFNELKENADLKSIFFS